MKTTGAVRNFFEFSPPFKRLKFKCLSTKEQFLSADESYNFSSILFQQTPRSGRQPTRPERVRTRSLRLPIRSSALPNRCRTCRDTFLTGPAGFSTRLVGFLMGPLGLPTPNDTLPNLSRPVNNGSQGMKDVSGAIPNVSGLLNNVTERIKDGARGINNVSGGLQNV